MIARNDGAPAFPMIRDMRHSPDWDHEEGMTLRDYFAAKAMQGDIASMDSDIDPAKGANAIAKRAYAIADAMLKARQS